MAKAVIFKAIVEDVRYFPDTNQTRVVVKITHADPGPDYTLNPNSTAEQAAGCKLIKPIIAAFRLEGDDALYEHCLAYTATPQEHQAIRVGVGSIICFEATAVGEGKSQWFGEPMRVLIGFRNETLCFQVRRKRVDLVFAGHKEVSLEFESQAYTPVMPLPTEDELFDTLGEEVMQGAESAPIEESVELVELQTAASSDQAEVLV